MTFPRSSSRYRLQNLSVFWNVYILFYPQKILTMTTWSQKPGRKGCSAHLGLVKAKSFCCFSQSSQMTFRLLSPSLLLAMKLLLSSRRTWLCFWTECSFMVIHPDAWPCPCAVFLLISFLSEALESMLSPFLSDPSSYVHCCLSLAHMEMFIVQVSTKGTNA